MAGLGPKNRRSTRYSETNALDIMTVFPLIHLNGSSRERRLKNYIDARRDVQRAIRSFLEIDFHRRDYYLLAEGSWEVAQAERAAILENLWGVHRYLESHIEHLNKSEQSTSTSS